VKIKLSRLGLKLHARYQIMMLELLKIGGKCDRSHIVLVWPEPNLFTCCDIAFRRYSSGDA
jgi:hypothetical protein